MAKKLCITIFMTVLLSVAAVCSAYGGVIAYLNDEVVVIEAGYDDYSCGELYSYACFLEEGDAVYGSLKTYGLQELYNDTRDESFTVYIEEYGLSEGEVFRWLKER